jgi:hypothetical protein
MADTNEIEALKTLQRIEKLLRSNSATSSAPAAERLSAKRLPGGANNDTMKDAADANKTLRAVAGASKKLNATTIALTDSFKSLNTDIRRASVGIGTFTSQLSKALSALKGEVAGKPAEQAEVVGTEKPLTELGDMLVATTKNFSNLNSELEKLVGNYARQAGVGSGPAPLLGAIPRAPGPAPAPAPAPGKVPGALQQTPVLSTIGTFLKGLSTSTVGLYSMTEVLGKLWKVTQQVTGDFFALSKVGLGSAGNLQTLYVNAAKAGMSLADYSKLLQNNVSLAARAGSLNNFDKLTSAADKQLAQLGVFGEDAKNLQATLLNTATLAGVPQAQFADVLNDQISTFDKLRKVTNLTASEFADLVTTVSQSDQAQKELVGLAPDERAARQSQLVELAATGRQLGLNADASKKLTDALIAQRGQTVKQRFEAAGRIRQLGAFLGLGDQAEEAAQITMKGRNATVEEQQRAREIAGNLDQANQQQYGENGFGGQNVQDQLEEALKGTAFGGLMEAQRPAQLAGQSAEVFNKDFGKHVGAFGQAVGNLLKYVAGIGASPLGPLLDVAAGAIAGVFGKSLITPLFNMLTKAFPSLGAKLFKGVEGGAEAGGGGVMDKIRSLFSAAKTDGAALGTRARASIAGFKESGAGIRAGAVDWVKNIGPSTTKWFKDMGATIKDLSETVKATPKNAWGATVDGLKSIGSTVKDLASGTKTFLSDAPLSKIGTLFSDAASSAKVGLTGLSDILIGGLAAAGPAIKTFFKSTFLVSAIIDGVSELFTGAITAAFSSDGGGILDRIGGVLFAALRAIPAMITDTIDYIFGTNLTNILDQILALARTTLMTISEKAVGLVVEILSHIPFVKDSRMFKDLKAYNEKQTKDIEASYDTISQLQADSSSDIISVGKKRKEQYDAQEDDANKATDKAIQATNKFNSTIMAGSVTTAGLIADAQALQGQQLAVPGAQSQATVNSQGVTQQAPVNTGTDQATGAPNSQPAQLTLADVVTALNKLMAINQQSVDAEQRQVELAEQMLSSTARTTRTFMSSESMNAMLLRA